VIVADFEVGDDTDGLQKDIDIFRIGAETILVILN
jgi:hypothetical protein